MTSSSPDLRRFVRAVRRATGAVASRPWAALLLCAGLSVAGSAACALIFHWPEPTVHDEFSYLLQADTFRQGRLSNPPHALWPFFESFHILQQPTYASKYPPLQGLVIAAGWTAAGFPEAGLWLGGALMAAALWWMLRGFLPPRWALIGALLAVLQVGMTRYWTQTYWGGCVPAAAGAIFIGALPRIRRDGRPRDAALLGLGLGALALCRPFEGFLLALLAAPWLAGEGLRRYRAGGAAAVGRLVLPAALALLPAFGAMAVHNHAVTGRALRLPYLEHEKQYAVVPPMVWLPPGTAPEYRHEDLRRFWTVTNVEDYGRQRPLSAFLRHLPERFQNLYEFYLGPEIGPGGFHFPLLALAFLALPRLLRRRFSGLALASTLVLLAAALGQTYALGHYVAPAFGWLLLLVTGGLRILVHARLRGRPAGAILVVAILLLMVARPVRTLALARFEEPGWSRARFAASLEREGGDHLVVIRTGPLQSAHLDLIANAADIDRSRVVWARDMGMEKNRALLDYFAGRKAWLLEVGFPGAPVRVTPYPR